MPSHHGAMAVVTAMLWVECVGAVSRSQTQGCMVLLFLHGAGVQLGTLGVDSPVIMTE